MKKPMKQVRENEKKMFRQIFDRHVACSESIWSADVSAGGGRELSYFYIVLCTLLTYRQKDKQKSAKL